MSLIGVASQWGNCMPYFPPMIQKLFFPFQCTWLDNLKRGDQMAKKSHLWSDFFQCRSKCFRQYFCWNFRLLSLWTIKYASTDPFLLIFDLFWRSTGLHLHVCVQQIGMAYAPSTQTNWTIWEKKIPREFHLYF